MPHTFWIKNLLDNSPMKEEAKVELIRFWNDFYKHFSSHPSKKEVKSKVVQYKEEVFDILLKAKEKLPLSEAKLHEIQIQIEDLTISFDEESIYRTTPNIIRLLIRDNGECAKDYLRNRDISKDDIELLFDFGQYTIEALMVHVLCMLFNPIESNSSIHVVSLVEQLESSIRMQASLFKCRRFQLPFSSIAKAKDGEAQMFGKDRKRSKMELMCPFDSALVVFMEKRGFITLNDLSRPVRVKKRK